MSHGEPREWGPTVGPEGGTGRLTTCSFFPSGEWVASIIGNLHLIAYLQSDLLYQNNNRRKMWLCHSLFTFKVLPVRHWTTCKASFDLIKDQIYWDAMQYMGCGAVWSWWRQAVCIWSPWFHPVTGSLRPPPPPQPPTHNTPSTPPPINNTPTQLRCLPI